MLYIHDKAKAVFGATSSGQHKIKKAKIVSITTEQTNEKANMHFLSLENKVPAHFVLDGSDIIKYDYNTTNVFPIDTKWTPKAKNIIEYIKLDAPEEITGNIKITDKPLTTKKFEEAQVPQEIILYYSNNTAEDFYTYLDMRQDNTAYHYILDDTTCYRIVSPLVKCYEENKIHIVVLGKNNAFDVFDRTAKLINQLLREFSITQYMPIEDKEHIHIIKQEYFDSIQERVNIIDNSGGTSDDTAISTRKDDANPGDHIITIKILFPIFDITKILTDSKLTEEQMNDEISKYKKAFLEEYNKREKALIRFLAEYLYYFNLDIYSVWRLPDLVAKNCSVYYYSDRNSYKKMLAIVEEALEAIRNGQDAAKVDIETVNAIEFGDNHYPIKKDYENDIRDIKRTKYFLTSDQKSINQDYDSITIGGNVEMRSKFEDGAGAFSETVQFSSCYYEPIYPDLTVPPRNSTTLYNKGLLSPREILKEMDQPKKPVIGKTPNAFDAYPVDDKIAQLEMHAPIVTLEYENAGDVQNNLFSFMNNRFGNTEKRLVRLENILSTFMRYHGRLAARVNINCVYYGGQDVSSKYNCIRCMCDDLTNDAASRTLDQCLNCSRYEPILGQFYEITGDNPGMAQIYDDVQASLMTKEEFAKFNNLVDYNEPTTKTEEDLTSLHLRKEEDKDYDELLDEANNFVMNWTEVPYHQQSPHINTYEYNPYEIYKEKADRLDKANVYEDGWREQEQLKFKRPQYNMNSIGGGNFNPLSSEVDGLNGLYTLNDFDINPDDVRLKIVGICESAIALAKQEKVLYTYGAKVNDQYMQYTPEELYTLVTENKDVNKFVSGRGTDDPNHKAVYFDCSSFASYIYIHCGVLKAAFTTRSLQDYYGFERIENNGTPILEQITKAYPGDLILYKGHVSIYAGEDYEYEASNDEYAKNPDQVCKSKIRNSNDFVGIYRYNTLSTPVIKNRAGVKINVTLDEFIDIEVGKNVGRDTNGDGYIDLVKDKDWLYDKNILRNYIDPKKRLNPELKMQFASIRNLKTPGIITEDTINDYLLRKGGMAIKKVRGIKVDSNYNPVRDENGKLVWEEKYAFPRGDVWMAASEKSGLNPLFLMAHCAGETGYCNTSNWTNYSGDFMAKASDNYLFNAFGIWCYDEEDMPEQPALHRVTAKRKTEESGWFSLEKSVVEGAKWIAENYIGDESVASFGRRDTTYFMKWHFGNLISGQNPNCKPGTKQYATDVSWADQRAKTIYNALKGSPVGREEAIKHFEYFIPEFTENNLQEQGIEYTGAKTELGTFKITHYCTESCCNGKWGNTTAHGHAINPGVTIAVDKSIIPLGSWVYIEGTGYRKACDVGGGIKGQHIDVAVGNHQEALKLGVKQARVFLLNNYKGNC